MRLLTVASQKTKRTRSYGVALSTRAADVELGGKVDGDAQAVAGPRRVRALGPPVGRRSHNFFSLLFYCVVHEFKSNQIRFFYRIRKGALFSMDPSIFAPRKAVQK